MKLTAGRDHLGVRFTLGLCKGLGKKQGIVSVTRTQRAETEVYMSDLFRHGASPFCMELPIVCGLMVNILREIVTVDINDEK